MNPCMNPPDFPRPGQPAAASTMTRREIDRSVSQASFQARSWHGVVQGTVPVLCGHIVVDEAGQPTAVEAELDLAAIDTGNRRRDQDLRSTRFFDAAQHPRMHFRADDVVPSVDGWQVRGTLTVGRARCPVVMQVARGGDTYDGFVGTVTLTKGELGVRAPRFLIRDQVTLRIAAGLVP